VNNELRSLGNRILANGKVQGHEIKALEAWFDADGKVDRQEAVFLLDLYKRADAIAPAFERLLSRVIKRHLLADGRLENEEARWLRQVVLSDGKVSDREKSLLREIRGEAKFVSVEGHALFSECLEPPIAER
jgi:uncharacterized tellurite resistance protein B-like protein